MRESARHAAALSSRHEPGQSQVSLDGASKEEKRGGSHEKKKQSFLMAGLLAVKETRTGFIRFAMSITLR